MRNEWGYLYFAVFVFFFILFLPCLPSYSTASTCQFLVHSCISSTTSKSCCKNTQCENTANVSSGCSTIQSRNCWQRACTIAPFPSLSFSCAQMVSFPSDISLKSKCGKTGEISSFGRRLLQGWWPYFPDSRTCSITILRRVVLDGPTPMFEFAIVAVWRHLVKGDDTTHWMPLLRSKTPA